MSLILYLYKLATGFLNRLKEDHVSAYASQAALFMIMALFPMLILILNVIKYTPVTEQFLLETVLNFIPSSFTELAASIITDMYSKSSGTLISISIVLTIWSASRGILALIRGFRNIYHVEESRNYFVLRLIASLYTVLFVVGIVISLSLLVFGNSIVKLIEKSQPLLYDVAKAFINVRIFYVPVIMAIIFIFVYKLVPNGHKSMVSHLPGAIFSSVGWYLFSFFYSYYVDHFATISYSYGSLTVIVLLMLWLYICMYIIFIGAEINIYFHVHFKFIHRKMKKKKNIMLH